MKKIEQKGKVSFTQAVGDFFKGYVDFSGITTRAGYWWSQLMIVLVYIVLYIWLVASVANSIYGDLNTAPIIIMVLFTLAIIIPTTSLQVRRFRDLGIKGKAILSFFVIYYALAYTLFFSIYANLIGVIANLASSESGIATAGAMPSVSFSGSSPILIFLVTLLGIFSSVAMFLPSNYFATTSKNVLLQAIFFSKEEVVEVEEFNHDFDVKKETDNSFEDTSNE